MQLDKFKAIAKPRTPWQAIDLGFTMAKAWYAQLFLLWVIPVLILYIPMSWFFYDKPYIPALVIWWLKPLWERPLLLIASQKLFDQDVNYRSLLKEYVSLSKFDLFWSLTTRRFSFHRSFNMPVTVLEQLKSKARSARLDSLHRNSTGAASWALIVCVHIEMFILVGISAAIALLIPQGVEFNWNFWFSERPEITQILYNSVWVLSVALVSPFYVCSGFSLYLQRRIDLEAWDIEISFRQLAARKSGGLKHKAMCSIPILMLLSTLSFTPNQAYCEENNLILEHTLQEYEPSAEQLNAKVKIKDIFNTDSFTNVEKKSGFRFIEQAKKEEEPIPNWIIRMAEWLDEHGGMFKSIGDTLINISKFIEVILWCIVISIILYIAYHYRSLLRKTFGFDTPLISKETIAPDVLFGLEVTADSLPENVIESAEKLWHDGQERLALALLLRASIVKCLDQQCIFHDGNTEQECALIVQRTLAKPISDYFNLLVIKWQALAYAHKPCAEATFLTLCEKWPVVFTNE